MSGEVFRTRIQGKSDNEFHMHVVVLELQDECIVVPGFGDTGLGINSHLERQSRRGLAIDLLAVHLDNAAHVKWRGTYTGKMCYWHVERAFAMDISDLAATEHVGDMDDYGLCQLLKCMQRRCDAFPSDCSKNRRRRLKRLIDELETRLREQ